MATVLAQQLRVSPFIHLFDSLAQWATVGRVDIQGVLEVVREYEKLQPSSNLQEELKKIEDLKIRLDIAYIKNEIDTLLNGVEGVLLEVVS